MDGTTVWICQASYAIREYHHMLKWKIYNSIVRPAMLYGMETVPVTSSHVKKLEVTEMKMCRWACGRTCEKRKYNGQTKSREYHREVQESATQVVCPRKEARPRLHRKTDSGDVPSSGRRKRGRPKHRWMDCVNRDMRVIGTTKDEVHDRTGWRRIVSAPATPQPSGSG